MPREPVVVLHTALTNEISHSIQSIVHSSSETADGEHNSSRSNTDFTTAIFYSITSTQKGLQGVELGNYLIKSVVAELLQEFPRMHQFSSLSPIPGFKDWLVTEINQFLHKHNAAEFPELSLFTEAELKEFKRFFHPDKQHVLESVKKVLQNNSWYREPELVGMLRAPLTRLCARYLYLEKRRGFALNPVENFHLRNGAVLWRINWLADTSPRGLGASCSLMVNYRYFLHNTQQHSRLYMEQQIITASDAVLDLVRDSLPSPPHLSSASSLPPPTTQQQREDRTSTEEES